MDEVQNPQTATQPPAAPPPMAPPSDLPGTPPPSSEQVAAAEAEEQRRAAAVEAYARDHDELTEDNAKDALDWLLGANPPSQYTSKVELDTPDGPLVLSWTVRAQDGRKIDAIEERNRNEAGKLDVIATACQLVAESTVLLAGRTGHEIKLNSPEFLTMRVFNRRTDQYEQFVHASPAEAIEARFRTQLGLILNLSTEIRRISGFDPNRVGQAQRRLVEASGN